MKVGDKIRRDMAYLELAEVEVDFKDDDVLLWWR